MNSSKYGESWDSADGAVTRRRAARPSSRGLIRGREKRSSKGKGKSIPLQGLRVPRGWVSPISRHSAHEGTKVDSPTHRPPLSPFGIFLVIISHSSDIIGNPTSNIPAWSAVPSPPSRHHLVPGLILHMELYIHSYIVSCNGLTSFPIKLACSEKMRRKARVALSQTI